MTSETAALVVPAAHGRARLDLGRDLYALLGLVFDAVTMDQAAAHLRQCAATRTPCFLSTPNVNFVAAALDDASFRDSVLRSDLSVADGMPIVWAARWLGLPIRERVAGADLFDRLRQGSPDAPLKVYFLGGPEGAAERACSVLNAENGGVRCVGFDAPGFVSVDEMSGADRIARIDVSGADFVVVALGAKKGQAWIERNRDRWSPPLVSHLGAVVNFVAGTIGRAPRSVRTGGVEWLWRIKEDPALWRRYWHDGGALLRLLAAQVLPLALQRLLPQRGVSGRHETAHLNGITVVRMAGACAAALPALKRDLARLLREGATVQFDLCEAAHVDSAFAALLMVLDRWQAPVRVLAPGPLKPAVRRDLRRHGADFLTRP